MILLNIKEWEIYNVEEFLKIFNLFWFYEKTYSKKFNWNTLEITDGELIEELLDKKEGYYTVEFIEKNHTQFFKIKEYDIELIKKGEKNDK